MLENILELLQDADLRQKFKEAKTQIKSIELLTTAGTENGYNFTTEDVEKLLAQLALNAMYKLSEEELIELTCNKEDPKTASKCD